MREEEEKKRERKRWTEIDGIESEREAGRVEAGEDAYMCAMRCIGLAGRE